MIFRWCGQERPHLLGAQYDRCFAWLSHEGHQVGSLERHLEKEPERDDRAIDARRTDYCPCGLPVSLMRFLGSRIDFIGERGLTCRAQSGTISSWLPLRLPG